jgi:hypothetical protein
MREDVVIREIRLHINTHGTLGATVQAQLGRGRQRAEWRGRAHQESPQASTFAQNLWVFLAKYLNLATMIQGEGRHLSDAAPKHLHLVSSVPLLPLELNC